MARPLRLQFPEAFYHVFSRGNDKKEIFRQNDDYELFLATLKECSERFHVLIYCYCLMPSHFHAFIQTKEANLSQFMKRLLGVYTIRFNKRYKRVGHLFQGRYKAILVDKDTYTLELSRYIHLNPCKVGLVERPEDYRWSSMRHYINKDAPIFLKRDFVLNQFTKPKDYLEFVIAGLSQKTESVLTKAVGGCLLGSEKFIEATRAYLLGKNHVTLPSQAREILKIPKEQLQRLLKDYDKEVQIYGFWEWGRMTQKDIGLLYQKTDSAISHTLKRFEIKLQKDLELRQKVYAIEEKCSSFKN